MLAYRFIHSNYSRRKILFVLLFMAGHFVSAFAQRKDPMDNIIKADTYTVSLKDKSTSSAKLPFKTIKVLDYRYDTSKIGYLEQGNSSRYSKISSPLWNDVLNNYFKDNLDPQSNLQLLIVLRSFWLDGDNTDELTGKKMVQKNSVGTFMVDGGTCKAGLDVYIETDSLTPCFRIDDAFLEFYKFKATRINKWLFLPFDSMAKKITELDIPRLLEKRRKTNYAELKQYYEQRFQLPILRQQLTTKGVFLSFDDFKKNKLTTTEFRVAYGRLTDEVYLTSNSSESLLTDFWGLWDGKNLFIKVNYSIYQAVRQQNSFEVYGGKYITNSQNKGNQNELIKINEMNIDQKILQLDMDTGFFF